MRAECVVPLFVAVAVKQSKHYAYMYLKSVSSAMCSHQRSSSNSHIPKAFSLLPQYFWVRRLGSQGQVVYSGKDPFLYDAFHL